MTLCGLRCKHLRRRVTEETANLRPSEPLKAPGWS
jgi:hypothetical protein